MRHEYDTARRHAHNTISDANRRLDKTRDPMEHHMLMAMIADATRTLNDLDNMDAKPYRHTDIGYNADIRRTNDAIRDAIDLVDRILPRISDDMDMRRGVPGTGRGRRSGRVRADMDDRYDVDDRYDRYDDVDDDDLDDRYDMDVVNMPRWRSARTGRFLPNLYGPRRVRRVRRRRADLDDRTYADARYDRYDDMRYDDARYDDYRTRSDHEIRMDDITRTAADAAADTARRMVDDRRDIYPHTPVMRYDSRYDRYDRRDDARYDTRDDRRDDADTAFDRARKPGPDTTRR